VPQAQSRQPNQPVNQLRYIVLEVTNSHEDSASTWLDEIGECGKLDDNDTLGKNAVKPQLPKGES
jgi:hypothetical protein